MNLKILVLSIILHMITISCILGIVFYFIIQKSSYRVFSKMLLGSMTDNIVKLPGNIMEPINRVVELKADDIIQTLNTMNTQEPATTTSNRKLFKYWNICIAVQMAIFILLVLVTKAHAEHEFYIMLFETTVAFLLVGCIELAFFYLIALRYAPVYPSEIEPLFIKAAQEYMANNNGSILKTIEDIISE